MARTIEDSGIAVEIRSVLTCESKRGVCVKCCKNLASGMLQHNVM